MHFSDDDMSANSSLSKRYVWGRIRQVQSDSDTRRNPRIEESNLLPKRQRQQVRHRIEKNISIKVTFQNITKITYLAPSFH